MNNMKELFDKIIKLSESRVQEHLNRDDQWCIWSDVHQKWFLWEVDEAINEIRDNNTVYLEDELWDVFWTYCWMLNSLEKEWKITSIEKVFERAYKKFSERVDFSRNSEKKVWVWDDIKKIQKKERTDEHNDKYNKIQSKDTYNKAERWFINGIKELNAYKRWEIEFGNARDFLKEL